MKYCRLCKTYHPEYDDNCPLCGAGLTEVQDKADFDFAPYNSNEKKTNVKKTVRDIFFAISVLTLVGLLLASVISGVYPIIYILACNRSVCVFPNGFALGLLPLDFLDMCACGADMPAFRQVLYRAFLCDTVRRFCAVTRHDIDDFYHKKMV